MSKALISSLIDEINILLSRPVGSVSRKASQDTIHQREQLKLLRSHLETLTDDAHLGNLDKQYQALVTHLQRHSDQNSESLLEITVNSEQNNTDSITEKSKTDKLETWQPLLVSPVVSNLFGAESDFIMETSTMTNGTPEPNSTFVNDRMIAALQQAIQQTLQQVVKESVQLSVQEVVSQTLAVERALMVGEISASINKIVEAQQQSQINQELINLNQQKEKLSAEISQLEADRANWMKQFQAFQSAHQESLDRSLQSVNNYLRDQITDTLQQTMSGTVASTVNQTVAQTLQDNLVNLPQPTEVTKSSTTSQQEAEFVNKVQEQTDRFLLHLDEMFSSTFRSLEQDIQTYQSSIAAKLDHIETLEQKGEALINALVDRISQQSEQQAHTLKTAPEPEIITSLPELPDDIPIHYLETATEPADENLINALLAGNEFGEPITEVSAVNSTSEISEANSLEHNFPQMESLAEQIIDIQSSETYLSSGALDNEPLTTTFNDFHDSDNSNNIDASSLNLETLQEILSDKYGDPSDREDVTDLESLTTEVSPDKDIIDPRVTEFESLLGASPDTLFEQPKEKETPSQLLVDISQDSPIIEDRQSALAARELNPDFDVEAATQIVEVFETQRNNLGASLFEEYAQDLQQMDIANSNESASPELMQWLDERSEQPNPINIAEVSPDADLMSWIGNETLNMSEPDDQEQNPKPSINSLSELAIADSQSLEIVTPQITQENAVNISVVQESLDNRLEEFLSRSVSDQAEDSEESLILLTNKTNDQTNDFPVWEDSLVHELSSDLERLESGVGGDPLIAANLDQFIRNTPYAFTNWDAEESQSYPTIIDISVGEAHQEQVTKPAAPESSDIPPIIENPNALFVEQFADSFLNSVDDTSDVLQSREKLEISADTADSLVSPFNTQSKEVPEIFDNPDLLFDANTDTIGNPITESAANDEMDAIFAEVIAENAARHSVPPTPFAANDELDELFGRSSEASDTSEPNIFSTNLESDYLNDLNSTTLQSEPITPNSTKSLENENDFDTLLFGFDPITESEHIFNQFDNSETRKREEVDTVMQELQKDISDGIDLGAETIQDSLTFSEPIEIIEELDTILQGFAPTELTSSSSDATSFMAIEDAPTVLEDPSENIQDNDWSLVLEQIEATLVNPVSLDKSELYPTENASELSADEFFASLEYDKLNNFADSLDRAKSFTPPSPVSNSNFSKFSTASFDDLDINLESLGNHEEDEDMFLNKFADSQTEQSDNDWDNLINDLNSFNFKEPLVDEQREQLGLSSVAPIADSLANVLDIDSLVLESSSQSLIPAPPEKEVYSLDDTWILGVDFGSTAIRVSLLNANTGKVYPLFLDEGDQLPCKLVWSSDHSLDDPIQKDIRVLVKKAQLESGEIALDNFKHFLKLGLPYRGVSTWQPIFQWSDNCQVSLRWLISGLKSLLEQVQTRANHPKLPDVGLILLKLSGVVFGYPSNWSDTYILNVREAILKAGLVGQAEQVMAVEQAIAPVVSLLHDQKLSPNVTLLIDMGAVTTSLCLTKGMDRQAIDRSKIHLRSLDYAGLSISQDIVVQLFYPHWQLITNPNRHLCKFEHLSLPEIGASAPQQRCSLQQYLLSSQIGQQMMELADRVKVNFGRDSELDSWNEEIVGQPILVLRRELENLILQPFIQRLNRELNLMLSNAGILGEDVQQVLLLGSTVNSPLLSRWLSQKLPNASIDPVSTSIVATGLAVSPLYTNFHDVPRQQYSDYFLLQEICRLNLTQPINPTQLLKNLQMRGVNIKSCRDRILTILQGDLPEGLFPWQESTQGLVLEDPTLSSELFAGRLFELETDGTYQPNVVKFQQLRVYLQAIVGNMSQTLSEPLVFPEIAQ